MDDAECRTVSVPEAGRWLGIGRLLRVPVVALERKLEEAGR
jgi:hypothetical protein